VSVAVAVSREYVEVWRTDDCAAFESVYVDENGVTCSELVIWDRDGSRYRELICGADLTTIRRDWEAASPFDKVQVPDDAGRKVWTHLVEDEPPAAVLEPEPARVSRRVDPQYEPPKEERDTPFTRWLSWGPGSI
jgi:hypothetical protein